MECADGLLLGVSVPNPDVLVQFNCPARLYAPCIGEFVRNLRSEGIGIDAVVSYQRDVVWQYIIGG